MDQIQELKVIHNFIQICSLEHIPAIAENAVKEECAHVVLGAIELLNSTGK